MFEICITGPSPATTETCQNADYNGQVLTFSNLVPGSYTVAEKSASPLVKSAWTVTGDDGATRVVPAAGGAGPDSTITNTRKVGSLQVTKVVNSNGTASD